MAGRVIPETAVEPVNPVYDKRERKKNLKVSSRNPLRRMQPLSPLNERGPAINQER
jgi:hypothetical protein